MVMVDSTGGKNEIKQLISTIDENDDDDGVKKGSNAVSDLSQSKLLQIIIQDASQHPSDYNFGNSEPPEPPKTEA